MTISTGFILAIAPGAKPEIVSGIVTAAPGLFKRYGIRDIDLPYLFGQLAEETGGFTRLEENLFYTSTNRLRQVWPNRFKSDAAAQPYVRNSQKLANLVYGGRYGNTGPNDGWLFRGSGDMQTTFHDNFAAVQKGSGLQCVVTPDLLRTHPGALEAACVFWRDHDLGRFVDARDIVGLSKAINGGTTGLADRRLFTDRALKATTQVIEPVNANDWLRAGSNDKNRVVALQHRLQVWGYYKDGKVDGVFGDGTEGELKRFQRDRGLVGDGVVGPATQRALDAAPQADAPDPHGLPADPAVPVPDAPKGLAALFAALISLLLAIFKRGK